MKPYKLVVPQNWAELERLEQTRVIIKGGPTSGHYGHLGRPGQVGGSQEGSLRSSRIINPKYLQTKKWKQLTSEFSQSNSKELEEIIKWNRIPSNHLLGLTKITPNYHPDSESDGGYGNANAHYHNYDQSIHLNVNNNGLTGATFTHELGHHVDKHLTKAKNIIQRRIINESYHTIRDRLRANIRRWQANGQIGPNGEGFSAKSNNYLSKFGLRLYSLTNSKEFTADAYKVSRFNEVSIAAGSGSPPAAKGLQKIFDKSATDIHNRNWYNRNKPINLISIRDMFTLRHT